MAPDRRRPNPSQRLLTPEEAADYLQVAVKTLTNWRHLEIGPKYCKVGGRLVRYRLADLDEYLAGRTQLPAARGFGSARAGGNSRAARPPWPPPVGEAPGRDRTSGATDCLRLAGGVHRRTSRPLQLESGPADCWPRPPRCSAPIASRTSPSPAAMRRSRSFSCRSPTRRSRSSPTCTATRCGPRPGAPTGRTSTSPWRSTLRLRRGRAPRDLLHR